MKSKTSFGRFAAIATALGAVLALSLSATMAHAAGNPNKARDARQQQHNDNRVDERYSHNRSYPVRGYVSPALPQGYRSVSYRGSPYYFSRGAWYRSYGPRYVVVAPPIGIGIGFLPPYYTRVWIGGMPYYYADDTYYMWRPERREYVVTTPPAGETRVDDSVSQGSDEIFVYPKNGQGEERQNTDRYECHSWAVEKTGFDPTRSQGNVDEAQIESKRSDYRRAEAACLDARGYSVK